MKKEEKNKDTNLDKAKQEIEEKKRIPKEELDKIHTRIFKNLVIAIVIMFYFYFINLGYINIQGNILTTDLKVFSMGILVLAIILFEYSYKKDDGIICIHGIEVLVLAIVTLFFISIYTMYTEKFNLIVATHSFIFASYYVAKSIAIQNKMKKQYYKSINDITEIVKKK